jgi:cytoskeletal protein CcmA (bactofilin family)
MLFIKKPEGAGDTSEPLQSATTLRAPSRSVGAAAQTVVDAGLTITGNLQSQGDVQVDGKICGDVHCAHLLVGKDGIITGDIVADQAVVRGKVKGTIRANRVVLQESARVESEIFHKTLSVDEGASFDGQSRRTQDPLKGAAKVVAAPLEPKAKPADLAAIATKKPAGNGASLNAGA